MTTRCLFVLFALNWAVSYSADLPRSSPEAQGVSSSAVLSFVEAADKIDSMNSVHGRAPRHGRSRGLVVALSS